MGFNSAFKGLKYIPPHRTIRHRTAAHA